MLFELKNHLANRFEVIGLIKPRVGAEMLVKSSMSDSRFKSVVVVFCAGLNDVSKNNSNIALKHILNFIKDNNNTNIIVLSVPHRHDLMDS
jgi:hypothetical protein